MWAAREVKVAELETSFRRAWQRQTSNHPNYGKGSSMTAEDWWAEVVHGTFQPLIGGRHLPAKLCPALFRHFASRDAYGLFPDVEPFFQAMKELRARFRDSTGPTILTGVITNSDDRVSSVLKDLGLPVGVVLGPMTERLFDRHGLPKSSIPKPTVTSAAPVRDATPLAFPELARWYNPEDDINFLITSRAANCIKPSHEIFQHGGRLVSGLLASRVLQDPSQGYRGYLKALQKYVGMSHIHVGDDFVGDYQGASKLMDTEALHLCRDISPDDKQDHQISNLSELFTYLNVMANVNLSRETPDT